MTAERTIYDIAKETPTSGIAAVLRCVIARIAVEDPRWRETYDRMLESQAGETLRHPETVTIPGEQDAAYQPVLLGDLSRTVEEAARSILEQAGMLGVEPSHPSDVDLAAAVIAAEVWMAAVNADNLAYAAAKGPDAIAAAAAILARVTGNGIAVMPLDPDWPALNFPQRNVLAATLQARRWVETQELTAHWSEITAMVVTDLGYRAHGGSKTHEASLLLGVRMHQLAG
jgi:hypothetical protein